MRERLEGSAEEGGRANCRVGWRTGGVGWHWAGHVMALGRPLYGTGPAAVAGWAGGRVAWAVQQPIATR
jgi:hypothetical protein